MTPKALEHLESDLCGLETLGLLRSATGTRGDYLVLCGNDYLGYARRPLRHPAGVPAGSGASRLVSGDSEAHRAAERALAEWVGAESALLFTSGYAANVGTIAALAAEGDVVISDALNHASIIDGCRLSRARVVVVPHLDTAAVERALRDAQRARRRWVVTESYFSMDADTPNLAELRRICDALDAGLIVDEAHALGAFGPRGSGLCAAAAVRPDVLVGTLGKAVGLQGAFVAGADVLRRWLWNRARSFVFSTGLSPLLASAASERVRDIARDDAARERLTHAAARLRQGLAGFGARVAGHGAIVPCIVGEAEQAVALSDALLERGLLAPAIRPPTVPVGTSRLRLTASAALTDDELERALAALSALRFV